MEYCGWTIWPAAESAARVQLLPPTHPRPSAVACTAQPPSHPLPTSQAAASSLGVATRVLVLYPASGSALLQALHDSAFQTDPPDSSSSRSSSGAEHGGSPPLVGASAAPAAPADATASSLKRLQLWLRSATDRLAALTVVGEVACLLSDCAVAVDGGHWARLRICRKTQRCCTHCYELGWLLFTFTRTRRRGVDGWVVLGGVGGGLIATERDVDVAHRTLLHRRACMP